MKKRKISKERRQKRLTAAPLIIRALYKNVSGNEASLRFIQRAHEEQLISTTDQSLTYGEVVPSSFLQILGYTASFSSLDEPANDLTRVFYDLGCGTGRAVFCAALSPYPFSKVIGIEIIPELCESAIDLKNCLLSAVADSCKLTSVALSVGEKITARKVPSEQPKAKQRIALAMLNEDQLLDKIKEIIMMKNSGGSRSCSQEFLCNELTKQLGHKIYKGSLQPFGKFSRFMERNSDSFSFSSDGSVALFDSDSANHLDVSINLDGKFSTISLIADEKDSIEMKNILLAANNDGTEDIADRIVDDQYAHMNDKDELPINTTISVEVPLDIDTSEDAKKSRALSRELKNIAVKSVLMTASCGYLESFLPLPEINFIEGDIFEYSWHHDADVVYVASLLFTDSMMEKLTEQALKMKRGSWIISLKSLKLTSIHREKVILSEKSFHKMSWQMAEVYIYQMIS